MTKLFDQPYCSTCEARLETVLRDVDATGLTAIESTKACNFYKKGEVIFAEGNSPTGLYCVHQGKIRVYKTGDEGRDHIVRFAKAGDVVGYRSLVSGDHYSVSAAALEDSVVCCIPRKDFLDLLSADGRLSMRVIELLSGELQRAEQQIVNLAQKPVRERLAETLLVLKNVYGTVNGDDSALNIQLSREELASVVGTATETLVRGLAELKRANLIATDKRKIHILDVDGLAQAGNLHD